MKIWFHSKFNVDDKKRLITVFFNQFFPPKFSTCPRAVSPASWQDGWCPLTFLQTINCGNCCGATITSAFDGGDKSNRQPWFIPLFTTVRWVFDFTQLNLTLMRMMHHKHWTRTSVIWAAHNQSNTTPGRHTGAETRNTQHKFFLIESPEKTLGEGEDLDSTYFSFLFFFYSFIISDFLFLCAGFYFLKMMMTHVFLGVPDCAKVWGSRVWAQEILMEFKDRLKDWTQELPRVCRTGSPRGQSCYRRQPEPERRQGAPVATQVGQHCSVLQRP